MYKSPISVQQQFINDIEKETENAIMCRVRRVLGIDIDEKELLAALRYERRQYDNGYRDGLRAANRHGYWIVSNKSEWSQCSVCKRHFLYVWDYDNADTYCRHCGAKMDEPMEVTDNGTAQN